jgi:hypothetical protein
VVSLLATRLGAFEDPCEANFGGVLRFQRGRDRSLLDETGHAIRLLGCEKLLYGHESDDDLAGLFSIVLADVTD